MNFLSQFMCHRKFKSRRSPARRGTAIARLMEMTLTIRIIISAAWMLTAAAGAVFISNHENAHGAAGKTPAHGLPVEKASQNVSQTNQSSQFQAVLN
jgi:hypothetical protein